MAKPNRNDSAVISVNGLGSGQNRVVEISGSEDTLMYLAADLKALADTVDKNEADTRIMTAKFAAWNLANDIEEALRNAR